MRISGWSSDVCSSDLRHPRVGRLKTGTPPRLDGRTINWDILTPQPGDTPTPVFSFIGSRSQHPRQVPCHLTATNAETHDIIRSGSDRSPMFAGVIEGVGPRYCPSVEDKDNPYTDHDIQQVLQATESLNTHK